MGIFPALHTPGQCGKYPLMQSAPISGSVPHVQAPTAIDPPPAPGDTIFAYMYPPPLM